MAKVYRPFMAFHGILSFSQCINGPHGAQARPHLAVDVDLRLGVRLSLRFDEGDGLSELAKDCLLSTTLGGLLSRHWVHCGGLYCTQSMLVGSVVFQHEF